MPPLATSDRALVGPDRDRIQAMFARVARRYDLANSVLSLGVHHAWRRRTVGYAAARAGESVLDCATGTGDLALAFKRAVGPAGRVIGTDFSHEMLALAPAKAARAGLDVHFQHADVCQLPFADAEFDVASIAFGIRNVQTPDIAVAELARVVRPGGRVVILEFGQPAMPGLRGMFRAYSRHVLPRIGGLVTGEGAAYRYLQDSSAQFPCGTEFAALMKAWGKFRRVDVRALTGGIAWLYRAEIG